MKKPRIYTLQQLKDRLAYWQRRLGCTDWSAEVRIVRASEMSDRDSAGEIHLFPLKRKATIYILAAEDYNSGASAAFPLAQDMEYTLVHECVHLALHQLLRPVDDDLDSIVEEQTVHALAMALISKE